MRAAPGKSAKFFLKSIKKKPKVKEIYDNLDKYSVDDICARTDIGKWFRDRLVELKNQGYKKTESNEEILQNPVLSTIKYSTVEDPDGDVYEIVGTAKIGDFVIDDDLLFVSSTKVILAGSQIVGESDSFEKIKNQVRFVTQTTKTQYSRMYQEFLNRKHGLDGNKEEFEYQSTLTQEASDLQMKYRGKMRIKK